VSAAAVPKPLACEFACHAELAKVVFGDAPLDQKAKAMHAIKEQTPLLRQLFAACDAAERHAVQAYLKTADLPLLNTSALATKKGIAFCATFGRSGDQSCYMPPREIASVALREGESIDWQVISAGGRPGLYADDNYNFYYASQCYGSFDLVDSFDREVLESHAAWGADAFAVALNKDVPDMVYSRSHPVASHLPAIAYKLQYPSVRWVARMGDPLSMSVTNKRDHIPQVVPELSKYSDDYYESIELAIYDLADQVLVTNENQFLHMHAYCRSQDLKAKFRDKAVVFAPPSLDSRYCDIHHSKYQLVNEVINIAYFGIMFYRGRELRSFFELLENPQVVLHIFAPVFPKQELEAWSFSVASLTDDALQNHARVCVNDAVGNLEFLNIAQKMDYLYVEDLEFAGPINPYLPSKVADYRCAGSKILAKVQEGSALSKIDHPDVIRFTEVTPDLLDSLAKQ
jgi:hypothetical protein